MTARTAWLAALMVAASAGPSIGAEPTAHSPALTTLLASARATGATPRLRIVKSLRKLQVLAGDQLLRTYSCVFGAAPLERKRREGDHKTPEGGYFICNKNANSRYHLFLGLSYPSGEDARLASSEGRVTKRQASEVTLAERERRFDAWPRRLWYTPLGGEVGIHGLPEKGADATVAYDVQRAGDWTWGCISVLNRDIEDLFAALAVGTPVEIVR